MFPGTESTEQDPQCLAGQTYSWEPSPKVPPPLSPANADTSNTGTPHRPCPLHLPRGKEGSGDSGQAVGSAGSLRARGKCWMPQFQESRHLLPVVPDRPLVACPSTCTSPGPGRTHPSHLLHWPLPFPARASERSQTHVGTPEFTKGKGKGEVVTSQSWGCPHGVSCLEMKG